ncbi:hypothetical protein PIB30_075326 [Stylosanthes scabra]|uniref:Uncharacterized protein n=1 Tax=Stylosanthes scabra TaxID=79078 RepID=A0ABU6QQL3_9FABA|nr:hypothetical protein [Stylosanthes scabra]
MAGKGKAPARAPSTRARVDKKGKKVVHTPPTRASARLVALKTPISPTPTPASSTPVMSQPAVKKPIFIDLTKDSELEGGSKEENPERKLAYTLRGMIGLGKLENSDSDRVAQRRTMSLEMIHGIGIMMILMIGEPQNHLLLLREVAPDIHHQSFNSAEQHFKFDA